MNENEYNDPEKENIARIKLFGWFGLSHQTDCIFSNNPALGGFNYSNQYIDKNSMLPTQMFYKGIFLLKIRK